MAIALRVLPREVAVPVVMGLLWACSSSGSDSASQSLGTDAGQLHTGLQTDAETADDAAEAEDASAPDDAGDVGDAGEPDDAGTDASVVNAGFALDFGTGSPSLFVQVDEVTRLKAATSFTLEAWLRLGTPPATGLGCVFCVPYGNGNGDTLALWFSGGYLYWGVNLLSGQNGEAYLHWTLPSETWHHVAAIYNQETHTSTLYVDGALAVEAPKQIDSLTYDSHPLMIGADLSGNAVTFGFSGWIDEVRMYDGARSEAQIGADMRGQSPLLDGALFGYYPFNEGTGSSTEDRSTTAASGQLGSPDGGANAPAWVASEVVFSTSE